MIERLNGTTAQWQRPGALCLVNKLKLFNLQVMRNVKASQYYLTTN
jgi:hypothetical protein